MSRLLGTRDVACCPMRGKEGGHLSSGIEAIPGALIPGAPAHSREHLQAEAREAVLSWPQGGPKQMSQARYDQASPRAHKPRRKRSHSLRKGN